MISPSCHVHSPNIKENITVQNEDAENNLDDTLARPIATYRRSKKDKQRLWLKRPMVERLVFHGKESDKPFVVLDGRAPAQATGDGTRLVKVRQSTVSVEDLAYIDEINEVICPTLLGKEGLLEIVNDQSEVKMELGCRLVLNPFSPIGFAQTPLDARGGRWSGFWASHMLLSKDAFIVPIPAEIGEFASCTMHTWALSYSICEKIIENNKAAVIVIQGAGLLGLYCSAILSRNGHNVFCCDKNSKRLRIVTEFGAVPLHPSLMGPVETKANYVIECTGNPSCAKQAFQWLGHKSEYILAGLSQVREPLPISGRQIIQQNVTISGVNSYSNEHLTRAVEFVSKNSKSYPWHKLAGPHFELSEWSTAIEAARQNKYYRVLFRPEKPIQPRLVPQIDESEAPNSSGLKKIPDELHNTLQKIITDAVPVEN